MSARLEQLVLGLCNVLANDSDNGHMPPSYMFDSLVRAYQSTDEDQEQLRAQLEYEREENRTLRARLTALDKTHQARLRDLDSTLRQVSVTRIQELEAELRALRAARS